MGLKVGQRASFEAENGRWSRYNPQILCESFFVDPMGYCRDSFVSINKGKECVSDDDCYTSQNENFYCKCTLGAEGGKVCDTGPADEEWIETKNKVILLYV